jgi:hypothetical protein
MVRAIALSIALLIGLGSLIPLATEYAEAGAVKTRKYKKKKREWKGVKKYSKRWWQLYRAQERRKKALAQRRRTLRLRQMRYAKAREAATGEAQATAAKAVKPAAKPTVMLPSGQAAPKSWQTDEANGSEVRFKVANGQGGEAGSAAITVVGPALGESVATGRQRSVGGVATQSLRREVINRMIRENGWVVNDFQKEIGGKSVYVVVAQSQAPNGRVQSRMFYFTESNGRIYSVATNSSADAAERIAEETENVIRSLQGQPRNVQQATKE